MRAHLPLITRDHARIQPHAAELTVEQNPGAGARASVQNRNIPTGEIPPAVDFLRIAGGDIKALGAIGDVDQGGGDTGHQLLHKGSVESLLLRVIEMAGGRGDPPFIKGEQPFKAAEIAALGRHTGLMKIIGENVKHDVLPGDHKRRERIRRRGQKRTVSVDLTHRLHALLMTRAGNVAVHIVLGETDLSADFIRVNLSPPDQVIDRGFAHMEDVGDLLGGERLVLSHGSSPSRIIFLIIIAGLST